MWWSGAVLWVLLLSAVAHGAEKQVKLQDIERDNLRSKQQEQQQQQQQQQQQNAADQSGAKQPDAPQTYISPEQQYVFQPQQQIYSYPQVPNVALYPAFLAPALQNNQLGSGTFLVPDYQTAALQAAYLAPQQRATPPLYYPQPQLVYPGQASLPQQAFVNQAPKASFTHQAPLVKHSAQTPAFRIRALQSPRPASPDVQQSNYNPIPRELQSYTTIPESVYQGREPAYLYDSSAPAVSLTTDQQQQRQASQRPVFAPGVKNVVPIGQLKPNPAGFSLTGNVPGASRHFPGSGVSFSTFRRVPSSS